MFPRAYPALVQRSHAGRALDGILLVKCGILLVKCGILLVKCGILLVKCGILLVKCGILLVKWRHSTRQVMVKGGPNTSQRRSRLAGKIRARSGKNRKMRGKGWSAGTAGAGAGQSRRSVHGHILLVKSWSNVGPRLVRDPSVAGRSR